MKEKASAFFQFTKLDQKLQFKSADKNVVNKD